ncbi:MAG TPA: hypothetical protein VF236_01395 [Gaiellaceae bacterium]
MTEPERPDDAPLEREAREAARGESEKTPLLLIGGVGGTIAIVAGVLIVAMLLIWRFV